MNSDSPRHRIASIRAVGIRAIVRPIVAAVPIGRITVAISIGRVSVAVGSVPVTGSSNPRRDLHSSLLSPAAEIGRLKGIAHHRVAPPSHVRRPLLPLWTFRFCFCGLWFDFLLRRRCVERFCAPLERYGYALGPGRMRHQTNDIHGRAGRRLISGQTGIDDARRLHQAV